MSRAVHLRGRWYDVHYECTTGRAYWYDAESGDRVPRGGKLEADLDARKAMAS